MGHWAERKIIEAIAGRQRSARTDLIQGIGDDCAVVRKAGGFVDLWTTDALVEGVHFDLAWHSPYLLGRKAASVNISDIGAMGGRPRFALLALGLSGTTPDDFAGKLMDGFLSVLAEHDMVLAGGDTVYSGERLMLSVTVCGEMAENEVRYRSGAQVGDLIWVSGFLGNAACGLELLRRGQDKEERYSSLYCAHLDPQPQVRLGRLLAERGGIHAMMDISDGLATDLAHICRASRVGADVVADDVPLADEFLHAAAMLRIPPMQLALQGGEDYQLVFTAPESSSQSIHVIAGEVGASAICIGRIVAGQSVLLHQSGKSRDITFQGYEHRF